MSDLFIRLVFHAKQTIGKTSIEESFIESIIMAVSELDIMVG